MFKKISAGIFLLTLTALTISLGFYSSFSEERLSSLVSNSQIANTAVGPIEYEIVEAQGPTILFLHGTPGGYDGPKSFPGFRVLAPSRPGYLRTPLDVGESPVEQAHAYAALLDTLDIDSVLAVGVSGGGPSAISFAAMYPEKTTALIAIEAVSQPDIDPPSLPAFLGNDFSMWAVLSLMKNVLGSEGIIEFMVPNPVNRALILDDAAKVTTVSDMVFSMWPISQRKIGMDNDFKQFSNMMLPNVDTTVPTLIIHGTEDINVPFAQSEKLLKQIPHAKFHVVEMGDHMMPFSHAEEVAAALADFLEPLNIKIP